MRFEDELAGVAILLQFAIHPRPHGQIVDVAYRLLGDYSRTERTERVHPFAEQELTTVPLLFLPVARRHVLRHCITEDTVLDVVIIEAFAFLADHYRQLGLPINLLQIRKSVAPLTRLRSSARDFRNALYTQLAKCRNLPRMVLMNFDKLKTS